MFFNFMKADEFWGLISSVIIMRIHSVAVQAAHMLDCCFSCRQSTSIIESISALDAAGSPSALLRR